MKNLHRQVITACGIIECNAEICKLVTVLMEGEIKCFCSVFSEI